MEKARPSLHEFSIVNKNNIEKREEKNESYFQMVAKCCVPVPSPERRRRVANNRTPGADRLRHPDHSRDEDLSGNSTHSG
jgi:hypothetical protein